MGVDFIRRHGFGPDGRMFMACVGTVGPFRPPRTSTLSLSSILGLTEYARATGDELLYLEARNLFERTWRVIQDPCGAWNMQLPQGGNLRIHGYSMITLNVIQQLRQFHEEPEDASRITACIEAMRDFHLRPGRRMLLEMTGWRGEDIPGSLGRRVNPGHMIEAEFFSSMRPNFVGRKPARFRSRPHRWGFEWGWDVEFGGIFNDIRFRRTSHSGSGGALGRLEAVVAARRSPLWASARLLRKQRSLVLARL